MSELANFPFVNQLDSSNNAEFNCVPASICACLRYLTGNTGVTPAQMKDAVYGPSWVNSGTSANAFVGFCEQHGVKLFNVGHATSLEAISDAHTWLGRGVPIIFTQQDDYSSNPNFTHVCVWYKDSPGLLTAMDPFGAKSITYSDAIWAQRLRSTELWIMQKENNMGVPQGWSDNGVILIAPNNVPIKLGFRQYVLSHNWEPGNVPLVPEYHVDQVQLHNLSLGPGQVQPTRDGILWYTPAKGVMYEPYLGLEIWAAYQKIADLQQQLQQAQQSISDRVNALQHKLDEIEQIIKS